MAENPGGPLASIFMVDFGQYYDNYADKPDGLSGGDDEAGG